MAEIAQLTLWEANELFDYWRDHPPTHVLVAAYLLGARKDRSVPRGGRKTDARFEELAQVVVSHGGQVRKRLPEIYRSARSPQGG